MASGGGGESSSSSLNNALTNSDHSGNHDDTDSNDNPDAKVKLVLEGHDFKGVQNRYLAALEKRLEEQVRRKKRDWEKEVERMKEEFLKLYPSDEKWGSDDMLKDPMVLRRRGSTDVLDLKKMKTLFLEYPGAGRRFKLRFDVSRMDPESVEVVCEKDRICVNAKATEEDDQGTIIDRQYCRKIEIPDDVDREKLKSILTKDGILIVEAPLPPQSLELRGNKLHGSPSRSSYSSHASSHASSRSRSPSNSPHTPTNTPTPKLGLPTFSGKNGERRMTLMVEVGKVFKPREVTVQVIKENRIMIKAKHEERTSERFSKSKYCKEFELSEKIEPYSLRAGMAEDGRLIVGALGKSHEAIKGLSGKAIAEELASKTTPCNVLDVHHFPPTTPGD